MATFTIDSFKHWQWAANSVYYLLSLWSRLVASMPYLKGDVPSQLESFVPQVLTIGADLRRSPPINERRWLSSEQRKYGHV